MMLAHGNVDGPSKEKGKGKLRELVKLLTITM